MRKYLPDTRTDPSDWKSGKTLDEIARLKADGKFLDLIQWRAHRSYPVGMADDGYVLEFRNGDAGREMFSSNSDKSHISPSTCGMKRRLTTRGQFHTLPHSS